jgi:neutral ceramidase
MQLRAGVACVWLAASMGIGCGGKRFVVSQPASPYTPAPTGAFRAGVASVDVTPHPGPPMFGHSTEGAGRAVGYQMRLRARALAFEDEQGERAVLVQLDLGASSGLIHREVSRAVNDLGLNPARVLFAATHTHAGPGGIYSSRFYNEHAAGRPGFDRRLTTWVAGQIERAIRAAIADLKPARLLLGEEQDAEVSRNRSIEAWAENLPGPNGRLYPDKDTRLRILRIEQSVDGEDVPVGAIVSFAVHDTALSHEMELYHPDLLGVAARALETYVRKTTKKPFVAAFINSAEGDISPNWRKQGADEAVRLGDALAISAAKAYGNAKLLAGPFPLRVGYREKDLPKQPTALGPLCEKPMLGVPLIAGAEDGRSFIYGEFRVFEGRRRSKYDDDDCHGYKQQALTPIQKILLRPSKFVRTVPFHVLQLGTELAFAGVPGEPTTVLGQHIEAAVLAYGVKRAWVVGLADEYSSYWTTPFEYDEQHYEGGSTIFGRNQGPLAVEQLGQLAKDIQSDSVEDYKNREFQPGCDKQLRGPERPCASKSWTAGDSIPERDSKGVLTKITFPWRGARDAEICGRGELPIVSAWCDGVPASELAGGLPEDDGNHTFAVARSGSNKWTADWRLPAWVAQKYEKCRLQVERPDAQSPLQSVEYDVK